jgi:trehalose 6-phosphate phosphatase
VPGKAVAAPKATDWSPWTRRPHTAGVITDYDGTLAPVIEERDRAVPLAGARDVLVALAQRLSLVAVVSGRPLDYLRAHLGGVPGLILVGLYGLEREQGGRARLDPTALAWQEEIAGSAEAAQREAPEGVEVERKGLAFTLHARRRPEVLSWAQNWARDRAAATGLVAHPGRLSVELLPPVATDKGTVVEELAAPLDAVCFIGDDRADLPAFAVLSRLRTAGKATISVGVTSAEQPEALAGAVDLLVDGPRQVVGLLGALAVGSTPPLPAPS